MALHPRRQVSGRSLIYALPPRGAPCLPARFLMLYVSEGCQPANRVFYVDLAALPRTHSGSIDFPAYDFFKKGEKRVSCR